MKLPIAVLISVMVLATGCVTPSSKTTNNKSTTMSQDDLDFAPRNEPTRAH